MKPSIGISESNLQEVATALNILLSDEVILYMQTRNYHWNIEGPGFSEMHLFYEKQFSELDDIMDAVAERIRMIGHYTEARLTDLLKLTHLQEQPYTNNSGEQLKHLLFSHEIIIRELRKMIPVFNDVHQDVGSSDFATQLLGKHEKMAWMIRSFIT